MQEECHSWFYLYNSHYNIRRHMTLPHSAVRFDQPTSACGSCLAGLCVSGASAGERCVPQGALVSGGWPMSKLVLGGMEWCGQVGAGGVVTWIGQGVPAGSGLDDTLFYPSFTQLEIRLDSQTCLGGGQHLLGGSSWLSIRSLLIVFMMPTRAELQELGLLILGD